MLYFLSGELIMGGQHLPEIFFFFFLPKVRPVEVAGANERLGEACWA